MTRKSVAMKVVEEVRKPLPKWVGVAGLVMVNLGTFGHEQLALSFGGGRIGEVLANLIPVVGSILSTISTAWNANA